MPPRVPPELPSARVSHVAGSSTWTAAASTRPVTSAGHTDDRYATVNCHPAAGDAGCPTAPSPVRIDAPRLWVSSTCGTFTE